MIDQQVGATVDRLLSSRLKAIGLKQSEKDLKQPVVPHAYNVNNNNDVQHSSLPVNTSVANVPSRVIPQGEPMQHEAGQVVSDLFHFAPQNPWP